MTEVQILIATHGPEGLKKIASLDHAAREGVEYLVSWQQYDKENVPESLRNRPDFKIFFEDSNGLSNNRNALLRRARGDIAVIADDDLEYTPRHLENIIRGFREVPDAHLLTFRYESEDFPKKYPDHSFNLKQPPTGYFVTSMELAFNLKKIRADFPGEEVIRFNPAFGVNGTAFGSGEEDILVNGLIRKGLKGVFLPYDICRNTESTTSERIGTTKAFIATKGAVMSYVKPYSWPLRMVAHALRETKGNPDLSVVSYCRWWISGVWMARKKKVFYD